MLMFFLKSPRHQDYESVFNGQQSMANGQQSVFNGQQSMANGQQSAFKKNPIFAL